MLSVIAGYGAITSALPYLALKIVWLSGGTLGVADQSMMRDRSMIVLNAIMLWLTALIVPGFRVHGAVTTVVASLILAVVSMVWKSATD